MRVLILVAAISLSARAQSLEPLCKTGDAACLQQLEAASKACGEVASLRVGEDDPPTVLREVEQVAPGWLFVWSTETGAASMSHWTLLDLSGAPFHQVTLPKSFDRRAEALLRKNETLCCRGWIPSAEKGRIVLISSLRRLDDPQATARGELRATLALRGRELVLQDLRRQSVR